MLRKEEQYKHQIKEKEDKMIKKIGIIGAMEEEVEALRAKLTEVQATSRASMDFYAACSR